MNVYIEELKQKALKEVRLLNKSKITDMEFFTIWNKYLYGYFNMYAFKYFLKENNIEVDWNN